LPGRIVALAPAALLAFLLLGAGAAFGFLARQLLVLALYGRRSLLAVALRFLGRGGGLHLHTVSPSLQLLLV
jgi:hypothetical protein